MQDIQVLNPYDTPPQRMFTKQHSSIPNILPYKRVFIICSQQNCTRSMIHHV